MFKRFPSVIKVGNLRIKVLILDVIKNEAGKELWGEYDRNGYTLKLHSVMPRGKGLEVVIHEVFHAIWQASDIHKKDKEERIITSLGVWLATVLVDNPALVRWIASTARRP